MAELGVNPVIQGILQGAGLAQQFRQQVLAEKAFKQRQDALAEEKEWREDQRRMQSQQQRMGMLQAGGRAVNGGQVRDDSQMSLASSPEFAGAPAVDVRMPTMRRPAQSERTFAVRGDDGQQMQYEMPSLDETQARGRQNSIQAFRDKINEELMRERLMGPVKAHNAGLTRQAETEATAIDPEVFSEAFAGNIVPGMRVTKELGDAIVTGARLRSEVSGKNSDRASRDTTARENRAAADARAAAQRSNSLSIAGMREAGANARHSTTAGAPGSEWVKPKIAELRGYIRDRDSRIQAIAKQLKMPQKDEATSTGLAARMKALDAEKRAFMEELQAVEYQGSMR